MSRVRWIGRCDPLACKGVGRFKGTRTTIPDKDGNRSGDLLGRDFTAVTPNRTWVLDFTCVRTWAGFAYVAFILDVNRPGFRGGSATWNRPRSGQVVEGSSRA